VKVSHAAAVLFALDLGDHHDFAVNVELHAGFHLGNLYAYLAARRCGARDTVRAQGSSRRALAQASEHAARAVGRRSRCETRDR
jgi:hypothetical protein